MLLSWALDEEMGAWGLLFCHLSDITLKYCLDLYFMKWR